MLASFLDANLGTAVWIIKNLTSKALVDNNHHWATVFGICCWFIWKDRCSFVFAGKRDPPCVLRNKILCMVRAVHCARMHGEQGGQVVRGTRQVKWMAPPMDTIKLNTDASILTGNSRAFGGGLFRDEGGRWMGGFVTNIGSCSTLYAELWCMLKGMMLALDCNFARLYVESDSLIGVEMVLGTSTLNAVCTPLVLRIRQLIPRFDLCVISHIHREGNFAADFLSHYACSYSRGVHSLDTPPEGLATWLLHDVVGVSYVR